MSKECKSVLWGSPRSAPRQAAIIDDKHTPQYLGNDQDLAPSASAFDLCMIGGKEDSDAARVSAKRPRSPGMREHAIDDYLCVRSHRIDFILIFQVANSDGVWTPYHAGRSSAVPSAASFVVTQMLEQQRDFFLIPCLFSPPCVF